MEIDPASYSPSELHSAERTFPETNCYTDLWIELLHARGLEPAALMAFAVAVDFEGDQWTFFKPPAADLQMLYGIDVHEMQLYRPIVDHLVDLLAAGRSMIVEVDSYHLPDTAGNSYRSEHAKTAIAVVWLDPVAERVVYFHGRGLGVASGDDYRGLLHSAPGGLKDALAPYAEIVRYDAGAPLDGAALRDTSRALLGPRLACCPSANPWLRFGAALDAELPALTAGSEQRYHAFAFATLRQAGAAFECALAYLDWAFPDEGAAAKAALARQVADAKSLLLKLARRRAFDPTERVAALAADYDRTIEALARLVPDAGSGEGDTLP
jgi:hypothetical protein